MPSNPFARGKTINVPKGKKKGDVFKRGNKKYLVVSYIHPSSGNRVRYGKPVKGIASGSAKARKQRKSRRRNPVSADMLLAGNPRIARWSARRRMARMPLPMKSGGSGRPFGGWGRRNPVMSNDLALYDDLAGLRNPRPKRRKAAVKRKSTKRKSAKRRKSGPVTVTFRRDARGRKLRKPVKVTFRRKAATPAQKRRKIAQGKRLARLGKPYRFKKGQKPPKKGQKLRSVGKKRKTTKRKAATKKVTIPKGKKKGQKFTKNGVQYVVKTRKTKAGGAKRYASKV